MSTRQTPGAHLFKNACTSDHHESPEPATAHGAFKSYWNADNNSSDVWYCERCAATGEMLGLFTRDDPDALVSCGLLAADDYHHVIGPDHRHGGIGNAEIVLEIRELPKEITNA